MKAGTRATTRATSTASARPEIPADRNRPSMLLGRDGVDMLMTIPHRRSPGHWGQLPARGGADPTPAMIRRTGPPAAASHSGSPGKIHECTFGACEPSRDRARKVHAATGPAREFCTCKERSTSQKRIGSYPRLRVIRSRSARRSAVVDPRPELPSTADLAAALDGSPGSGCPTRGSTGSPSSTSWRPGGRPAGGHRGRTLARRRGGRRTTGAPRRGPWLPAHGALLVRPDGIAAMRTTTPAPDPARFRTEVLDQVLASRSQCPLPGGTSRAVRRIDRPSGAQTWARPGGWGPARGASGALSLGDPSRRLSRSARQSPRSTGEGEEHECRRRPPGARSVRRRARAAFR